MRQIQKHGGQIAAWIQASDSAKLTEDDIRKFCDGQIAHYKVPHYVRFVEEFPMTLTGKIHKFVIRERMVSELES